MVYHIKAQGYQEVYSLTHLCIYFNEQLTLVFEVLSYAPTALHINAAIDDYSVSQCPYLLTKLLPFPHTGHPNTQPLHEGM